MPITLQLKWRRPSSDPDASGLRSEGVQSWVQLAVFLVRKARFVQHEADLSQQCLTTHAAQKTRNRAVDAKTIRLTVFGSGTKHRKRNE